MDLQSKWFVMAEWHCSCMNTFRVYRVNEKCTKEVGWKLQYSWSESGAHTAARVLIHKNKGTALMFGHGAAARVPTDHSLRDWDDQIKLGLRNISTSFRDEIFNWIHIMRRLRLSKWPDRKSGFFKCTSINGIFLISSLNS